jgi:hypothetical protein
MSAADISSVLTKQASSYAKLPRGTELGSEIIPVKVKDPHTRE